MYNKLWAVGVYEGTKHHTIIKNKVDDQLIDKYCKAIIFLTGPWVWEKAYIQKISQYRESSEK